MDDDRPLPAWALFLAGVLLALAALPPRRGVPRDLPRHLVPRPADAVRAAQDSEDPFAGRLPDAAPRELRRLPGVGQARAAALAQARWEARGSGLELRLEDLRGIGEVTARRVRDALRAPPDREDRAAGR